MSNYLNKAFEVGRFYKRRTLHQTYGGQERGGISTPAKHPLIFLFTGQTGEPFGYTDWWESDQIFHYYGEGQRGNMEFRGGNKAIRDHAGNGKELHVFKMKRHDPDVCYLGQMVYAGHDLTQAKDADSHSRTAIVFRLRPT